MTPERDAELRVRESEGPLLLEIEDAVDKASRAKALGFWPALAMTAVLTLVIFARWSIGDSLGGWIMSPLYEVLLLFGAGVIGLVAGSAIGESRVRKFLREALDDASGIGRLRELEPGDK